MGIYLLLKATRGVTFVGSSIPAAPEEVSPSPAHRPRPSTPWSTIFQTAPTYHFVGKLPGNGLQQENKLCNTPGSRVQSFHWVGDFQRIPYCQLVHSRFKRRGKVPSKAPGAVSLQNTPIFHANRTCQLLYHISPLGRPELACEAMVDSFGVYQPSIVRAGWSSFTKTYTVISHPHRTTPFVVTRAPNCIACCPPITQQVALLNSSHFPRQFSTIEIPRE